MREAAEALSRQLAVLPHVTLALNTEQTHQALAQSTARRRLRQQLISLHERLALQRRHLHQNAHSRETLHKQSGVLELETTISRLASARAQLQPGCPCPLCGATEHPAIESYQAV